MTVSGLLPVSDINYIVTYLTKGEGSVKGLLKAIGGVYNFVLDLLPDPATLDAFVAQGVLTDSELVEKLEDLKGFKASADATLPVWVIPVLLKLLDLAALFLRK